MPTKFAAKLIADSASDNPVLLKIDFDGGHAANVPIAQRYANIGDMFEFALWQLGHPDYQPKEEIKNRCLVFPINFSKNILYVPLYFHVKNFLGYIRLEFQMKN